MRRPRGSSLVVLVSLACGLVGCGTGVRPAEGFGWPDIPLGERSAVVGDHDVQVIPISLDAERAEFEVTSESHTVALGHVESARLRVGKDEWSLTGRSLGKHGEVLRFRGLRSSEGVVELQLEVYGTRLSFQWRG